MADTVEDSISKALNIPTVMRDVTPPAVVEEDDDFEYARRNMRDIIEEGKAVLAAAASLAQTSESPRAFEVVGQLISHMTSANKDLIDLKKKRKDIEGEASQAPVGTTVNAVFVGSTADLQKLVTRRPSA
jgi:coenzyme F420-reducing hydrogenase alpha subunit